MKKPNSLWVLAIGLLVPLISHAQAPSIEWQQTIGGNKSDLLYDIHQTGNGGYIAGGSSNSGPFSDKTEQSLGGFDYWVCKLDVNGNVLWDNTIGGSNVDYLSCLQQTKDGGYILGGESKSNASGDKSGNCFGRYDYWVVKLDGDGNIVWDKTLGGSKDDYLYCLYQTSDGGYIVGGNSESGISGNKTQDCRGHSDCWVVKLDKNGNIVWDKTIGGSNTDDLFSILQTADGGYVLGASSASSESFEKTEKKKGGYDYWMVKLDKNGNELWDKTIGGTKDDFAYSIKKVSSGGFLIGGYSESDITGDKSESCRGEWDYWVVKTDMNGNVLWDKTVGGDAEDELFALDESTDGGFLLSGYSESGISGDKTEVSRGYYDYWVVKLDQDGSLLWDKTLGGIGTEQSYAIDHTNDGGFVVSGYSSSGISGDKTGASKGSLDWWIIKFAADSPHKEAVSENTSVSNPLNATIYPNPTTGMLNLSVSGLQNEDAMVTILNMTGEIVYTEQFSRGDLESVQTIYLREDLPAGNYFVKISSGDGVITKPILFQK